MAVRVSTVALPWCGCTITLGSFSSSGDGLGSLSNTSRAAWPRRPSARALMSAGSSTTLPRATLMSVPFRPSASITPAQTTVPGSRPALTRDHEIVAAPRQLDRVGDVVVGRIGLAARPAVDHAHAQGGAAIGDGTPDAAEPEHAHGLAADAAPERDRPLARPGAVAHVAIGDKDLARGREHQADGEVGHLVRPTTWDIEHLDLALARGGEIDEIGSDPEDGDHLEL